MRACRRHQRHLFDNGDFGTPRWQLSNQATSLAPYAEGGAMSLAGIPRMNLGLTWTVALFWITWKPEWEAWMAPGIAGSPNDVEGLIWPFR